MNTNVYIILQINFLQSDWLRGSIYVFILEVPDGVYIDLLFVSLSNLLLNLNGMNLQYSGTPPNRNS